MNTIQATEAPSTSSNTPLVSIIAPCYNAEKYLELALASIYAQTYANVEVIIVDDGSSDRSVEMLEALQRVHGFQLYRQANQGVSAALNHGLRYAKGTYVCTPDLDDIMLPDSIAVRVAYLQDHPDAGVVGANSRYIDPQGNVLKDEKRKHPSRYDFADILANARVCGAPASLYRMTALKDAGFYDPAIKVQDFQMTLRIAYAGWFIDVIPVFITLYRRHPNNLSRRYRRMLIADMAAIAPYKEHPAYAAGRAEVIHKALKYAVVEDKAHALTLLGGLPVRHWNKVTGQRIRRLLLSWHSTKRKPPIE
jgi:alpha-1,6-rhamnosyltransferase